MKNILSILLIVAVVVVGTIAEAQQQAKEPKIGWLAARPTARIASLPSGRDLFWREFGALGYVEGKNVAFEYRSADNKLDRLPALADELVRLKVDVIVSAATSETNAAKKATKTIPIVFFSQTDPVENGLVESLARPGGNLTGFSNFQNLLTGKRLEILKESIPKLTRVAVLHNPQTSLEQWKENQLAAKALGLQLYSMEVSSADKLDGAFKETVKARSGALAVTQNPLIASIQKQVRDLAIKNRLPTIYHRGDFVESGGLMSYGADLSEPFKRAAVMVDKILKGTKPADIPVERPTRFEFIVNLKTAKQIGVTIPPNVLVRAQKVIR